jgi:hypothetical protein
MMMNDSSSLLGPERTSGGVVLYLEIWKYWSDMDQTTTITVACTVVAVAVGAILYFKSGSSAAPKQTSTTKMKSHDKSSEG